MCHCYDCRHITGMLAGDFVQLPLLDKDVIDVDATLPTTLSVYKKSGGRVNWYFCNFCGCHLLQSSPDRKMQGRKRWYFSMGTMYPITLDDGKTKITKLDRHVFVNYGLDAGGMTQFLPDNVPRYIGEAIEESQLADPNQQPTNEEQEEIKRALESPTMPLKCHCGNVNLTVHRPSYAPIDGNLNINDGWLWTFCMCSSCRTTSGFDNSSFIFAPYTHVNHPSDSSKHATDGLQVYCSYEGRRRLFCPTCGCKVFFDRADRGDLADAFLGAVDIPLSVMFSSWIRQAKSISFWAYAKNKDFAQTLANGFCPGKDLSLTENAKKQSANYEGTLQL